MMLLYITIIIIVIIEWTGRISLTLLAFKAELLEI